MAGTGEPIYELTYILDGVLAEDKFKDLVTRINKFIKDNGGKVLETDEWGMRQLAYPINRRRNGYYVNMYFNAPNDLPVKLERALRIDESVLRYMTLRLDAKMRRHFEAKKYREYSPTTLAAQEAAAAESGEKTD
jgi:small subunit ribosomal protein S6